MIYIIIGALAGLLVIITGCFGAGWEACRHTWLRRLLSAAEEQRKHEAAGRLAGWQPPREGRLALEPFPGDTGPLPEFKSERAAVTAAYEREIARISAMSGDQYAREERARWDAAARHIGPVP